MKNHKELIERVRVVDRDAALYMEEKAPQLFSFTPSSELCKSFVWHNTPQGYLYWFKIDKLVNLR